MTFNQIIPLAPVTDELVIVDIDAKDRTFILADKENEYTVDIDCTFFERFVRSKRLLERDTMERHFIYEWPVTVTEEISFGKWLDETPLNEIAGHLSNYYLYIGHKNMTLELEKSLQTSKLTDL